MRYLTADANPKDRDSLGLDVPPLLLARRRGD
jgi:hypothetical protein